MGPSASRVEAVAGRVRELAAHYAPPSFDHVPEPDAALFLCAIDHRSGYREKHRVAGEGPYAGSALMWACALEAARHDPERLTAARLRDVSGAEVAELLRAEGETVADPGRRAMLWRDLAEGLCREHDGRARALLAAAGCRLGGEGGLLALLAPYEAFSDPLRKKSFLFAKICERRGWLEITDPERWEVCADNVLMRLALRSALVAPGPLAEVRAATREAFKRVAHRAGVSPPVLDDLLWELGRDDPDLLGAPAGDVREPPRDPESHWY